MKIFLTVLILIFGFQTFIKADNISDFEIEGTSIGNSLLEYYNEKKIKDGIPKTSGYSSDKFILTNSHLTNYDIYESLQYHFKKESNYEIHSISGANFVDNMEDCNNQFDIIEKELSNIFKNANREDKGKQKHRGDPTGNSYIKSVYYYLKEGGGVRVACFDWSDKLSKEKNWQDHIKVSIFTEEILDWFTYEAYK